MKDCIIAIAVLFVILVPIARAQPNDFQSATSHYNQYSPDNINSSYSQYEVQYSPKNVIDPFPQQEHDYKANLVSPESKGKKGKAIKESSEAALISKFFEDKKPKNVLVFFYLLIISSLALGATILIFIGVFKK